MGESLGAKGGRTDAGSPTDQRYACEIETSVGKWCAHPLSYAAYILTA